MTQIYVLDQQTDNILGTSTNFRNDNHRETINNEEIFNFTESVKSQIAPFLTKRNRVIIPVDDGFFREFIISQANQEAFDKEVFTQASYIELKKSEPIAPIVLQGQTVDTSMDYVLNQTGWQRGITEYAGTHAIEFDEHINPYAALKLLASIFGLELRFRIETKGNKVIGRYVDMVKKQGQWRGKEITSGKDLINARRIESNSEVVTALRVIGPIKEDGSREIVNVMNEEARQVWGRIENGVAKHLWDIYTPQTSDSEINRERLTQLGEAELQKRISSHVKWEIDAVDIENIFGREHEKVRLGDSIRVKATDYNPPVYLESRVITREGSIRDKAQRKYYLGEVIERTEEDVKKNLKLLEKQLAKKINENQLVNYAEKIIPEQPSAPNPNEHPKWVDTSGEVPQMKLFDWDINDWTTVKGEKGDTGDRGERGPQGPAGKDGIAHMGTTAPSNPAINATWFQTNASGQVIAIKKWNGSAWITAPMTADVLSVLKLSALSADLGEVTAGKLKAVELEGVTGTFGNVGVHEGDFTLLDGRFETPYSIVPKTNLVGDHSFELVMPNGLPYSDSARYIFRYNDINTDYPNLDGTTVFWQKIGTPQLYTMLKSHAQADQIEPNAIFGKQAVGVNASNKVYQAISDGTIRGGIQYTVSAHFKKPRDQAAARPRIKVSLMKSDPTFEGALWSETKIAPISVPPNERVVRLSITFTIPFNEKIGAPTSTWFEIELSSDSSQYLIVDGVQMVESDKASVYDEERTLWEMLAGEFNYKIGKINHEFLALQSGWTNFGGAFQEARVTKTPTGLVVLDGLIRGGSIPSVCAVLPYGTRPYKDSIFVTASSDVSNPARIYVYSNGNITINASHSTYTSLAGISFIARGN